MKTKYIEVSTKGNNDIIDLTSHVAGIVEEEEMMDGIVFLTVLGSTAALTTMEYEPGLIKDVKTVIDELFPYRKDYAHNAAWSDDNAHSHLRSAFIKTQFFVSVTNGRLDLGTWQQVVLIDFDSRPRQRKIVVKIIT